MVEEYVLKVRVRFAKTQAMRFLGHLDIMRFFQKVMRRTKFPIKYTEGFSPHQIMSFGAPLSLGVESYGEYMDIELIDEEMEKLDSKKAIEILNGAMCEGLEILSFKKLPDNTLNAMSVMVEASYRILLPGVCRQKEVFRKRVLCLLQNRIEEILDSEEILIEKKVKIKEKSWQRKKTEEKTKIKMVDIRPLIYHLNCGIKDEILYIDMSISQGSLNNLKVDLVIAEFRKQKELEAIFQLGYRIYRMDMYAENHRSLDDFGEEII